MRVDGRQSGELRPVSIIADYLATAEGSALISLGNTRVICAATIEPTVPFFMRSQGRGWVTAEYSMLPRATVQRTAREITKGKPSGRTQEIQRLIGRSLRAVVDMQALGERTVILDCDVVQADGGTRTASITGAFVAMCIAMRGLVDAKTISKMPVIDYLAATSVGVVGGEAVLDLCYEEDSRAGVDANIVMTGEGRFVELGFTAEHGSFDGADMGKMLGLAQAGIAELIELQKTFVSLH
jgi:ribonuclease PH